MTGVDCSHSTVVNKFFSCERTPVLVVDKLLSTELSSCCETCLAGLSALCGHEDDTIGCT